MNDLRERVGDAVERAYVAIGPCGGQKGEVVEWADGTYVSINVNRRRGKDETKDNCELPKPSYGYLTSKVETLTRRVDDLTVQAAGHQQRLAALDERVKAMDGMIYEDEG